MGPTSLQWFSTRRLEDTTCYKVPASSESANLFWSNANASGCLLPLTRVGRSVPGTKIHSAEQNFKRRGDQNQQRGNPKCPSTPDHDLNKQQQRQNCASCVSTIGTPDATRRKKNKNRIQRNTAVQRSEQTSVGYWSWRENFHQLCRPTPACHTKWDKFLRLTTPHVVGHTSNGAPIGSVELRQCVVAPVMPHDLITVAPRRATCPPIHESLPALCATVPGWSS